MALILKECLSPCPCQGPAVLAPVQHEVSLTPKACLVPNLRLLERKGRISKLIITDVLEKHRRRGHWIIASPRRVHFNNEKASESSCLGINLQLSRTGRMKGRSSQRPHHRHAADSNNGLLNFTNFLILDGLGKAVDVHRHLHPVEG